MCSKAVVSRPVTGSRSRLAAVCLSGLLLVPAWSGPLAPQEPTFLRIATAATGTTNYDIGGVLANAVSHPPGSRPCDEGGGCGVPGLVAVVQTTNGSNENVRAVAMGQAETALAEADVIYWAYHGTGLFKDQGPSKHLRAIASLFPSTVHVVAPSRLRLGGIADLKGLRVSLGEENSSTAATAKTILAAYGLSLKDIEVVHAPPGASSDLLETGEIDAFFMIGGVPAKVIEDLSRRLPIRLLPINGTPGEELKSFYPFFTESVVDSGIYQSVGRTDSVSVHTQWITSQEAEEELVYALTAALWHESNRKLFENGHPEARGILLKSALERVAIPLHPGAARFYREIGLSR